MRTLMVARGDLKARHDYFTAHRVEVNLLRRRPKPGEYDRSWIEFREVKPRRRKGK